MQISRIKPGEWSILDLTISLLFIAIPLLMSLPYRVNIFLSWEGAYRLYLGQIPFRDFGLPMGFGYWIVPAMFFKVFGPTFTSLVIAQCFLNTIGVLSVRGILRNLGVSSPVVTLTLMVYCLTYIIYNFWPWYNNSVVIFELVCFWSLTKYLYSGPARTRVLYLVLSAAMAFLSFTKQDVGILCLFICLAILMFDKISVSREYRSLVVFVATYLVIAAIIIVPFLPYEFTYWFNLGQAPHNSRLGLARLLEASLLNSFGEKLYLGVFCLFLVFANREWLKGLFASPQSRVLIFLCVCLVGQAIVTRVSSPLPTDHMTYFHTFGFVLVATVLARYQSLTTVRSFVGAAGIIVIVYSAGYWNYAGRFLKLAPTSEQNSLDTIRVRSKWMPTNLPGFDKVTMPAETVSGIKRLMDEGPYPKNMKVLNMTELTPLAVTLNFEPQVHQPLWYHLNIGIFDKEVDTLCSRVRKMEYDLVLFEDIPDLTHFYPYRVRDSLRKYYHHEYDFLAPRKLENSVIEVYRKKNNGEASMLQ